MDTINLSQTHPSKPDWQLLGDLKLLIGIDTDDIVHTRLTDLLVPLSLPVDFSNRVLISVHNSITRALRSNDVKEFGHIHLSIFVPHEQTSKGKNWGYFHIERIEDRADNSVNHNHAIDFYLYMEGE